MYFYGKGVEQDYVHARELYEQVPDDKYALNRLADIFYEGLGVEKDLEKSREYREKARRIEKIYILEDLLIEELQKGRLDLAPIIVKELIKEGEDEYAYYAKVFEKIGNKKIIIGHSIADFIGRNIGDDIGGIAIFPNENFYIHSHTVYDIETFRIVKNATEEFLEDIPMVNSDKSNEFEVFEVICKKIAKLITVDRDEANCFTPRNLIGALLEKKCVCAGYAELLRNLCAYRGIECIFVGTYEHAVNQVKFENEWYWFDLIANVDEINLGINIASSLVSDKEFITKIRYLPDTNAKTYKVPKRYRGRRATNNIFRNALLGKNRARNSEVVAVEKYMSRKDLDKSNEV